MRSYLTLTLALILLTVTGACDAQTTKKDTKTNSSEKIEAYYFHFSARCVTCKTVEAEAKKNIETLYSGKISFASVNLDEESGKALAEKLSISGQTLIVIKGNSRINLTNEGFMYARTNPEKFKAIIKEKVDKLL